MCAANRDIADDHGFLRKSRFLSSLPPSDLERYLCWFVRGVLPGELVCVQGGSFDANLEGKALIAKAGSLREILLENGAWFSPTALAETEAPQHPCAKLVRERLP